MTNIKDMWGFIKTPLLIVMIVGLIFKIAILNRDLDQLQQQSDRYQKICKMQETTIDDIIKLHISIIEDITHKAKIKRTKILDVTSYSPRIEECDSDPFITASMTEVRLGIIAVSRDLFNNGCRYGIL